MFFFGGQQKKKKAAKKKRCKKKKQKKRTRKKKTLSLSLLLTRQRRLAPGHVPPDDKVRAAVVLPDRHVLHGLPRARHVHRVRQVRPPQPRVADLLFQDLVGAHARLAGDVVVLRGADGGVHEADGALGDVVRVERAREELVVRAMDRVAALEGQDVLADRQRRAHLGRRRAREGALGQGEALDPAPEVVPAALHRDHLHGRVLDRRRAVALARLDRLVGRPLARDVEDGELLALVGQEQHVPDLDGLVVRVEDDGEAEQEAVGQAHGLDDGGVLPLVHEPLERREAADDEQLDVAGAAVRELDGLGRPGPRGALGGVVLEHEVDEGGAVAVRGDEGGAGGGGGGGGAVFLFFLFQERGRGWGDFERSREEGGGER